MQEGEIKGGRHASWLELFFDLVVVVAVAQLAHLIHPSDEHHVGLGQVLLFAGLYYAVWSVWTSFTLYSNVAADKTRQRSMLIAMFGLAVMAAAISRVGGEHAVDLAGAGGTAFAVAYVACRALASLSWRQTGSIVTNWPAAQQGAGLLPWVISIWWMQARPALWALGIALDIGVSYLQSGHPDQIIAGAVKQAERHEARMGERRESSRRPSRTRTPFTAPHPARVDPAHLGERLGLFVIIVLGEAVAQVVMAAGAQPEWDWPVRLASVAGFGLLVCLYWLTLEYGPAAVPKFSGGAERARLAMPAHFAMTGGIAATAAGLGTIAGHAGEPAAAVVRWILCGGMIAYFLTSAVIGVLAKAPLPWLLGWALPSVVAPVLLAIFGGAVASWWLAAGLLATGVWLTLYPWIARRGAGRPERGPSDEGAVDGVGGEDAVEDE
ncbi:low temperature requirement protein A [Streptosporangiaceae bacterium NEAU-GS5]|nr:low temperature requirement protein A [Streptosporangiaceae bacterium NEAU-GS5]